MMSSGNISNCSLLTVNIEYLIHSSKQAFTSESEHMEGVGMLGRISLSSFI